MKQWYKTMLGLSLGLAATASLANAPKELITHNKTDFESNAFVAGVIPSPHPTKAHSDGRVYWTLVRMACWGHIQNNKCSALIKMKTNTKNPINIGVFTLDLDTGAITPKSLSANGFTVTVNGLAETTITQN